MFRSRRRKSALFFCPILACLCVFQNIALCSEDVLVVTLGPGLAVHLALASISLPETHQPELLEKGDEAVQDAVNPVHQTKVDADGL